MSREFLGEEAEADFRRSLQLSGLSAPTSSVLGIGLEVMNIATSSPFSSRVSSSAFVSDFLLRRTRADLRFAEVMFAGISLPGAYLKREALSLFILLFPIMTVACEFGAGSSNSALERSSTGAWSLAFKRSSTESSIRCSGARQRKLTILRDRVRVRRLHQALRPQLDIP